jgi:hypothetical protein
MQVINTTGETMKFLLIAALSGLTACGSIPASEVLEAVQLGPDECGTASISGSITVGGNPIASTSMHVDIDKEKKTYTDAEGKPQECDPKSGTAPSVDLGRLEPS